MEILSNMKTAIQIVSGVISIWRQITDCWKARKKSTSKISIQS